MIDLSIIKYYEGLKLRAYKCPAGVPTVGFGNTFYEDGKPVKMGDVITIEKANQLLENIAYKFLQGMKLPDGLTDNQQSALLSFAYNVGLGAWQKSTLRKKVLTNPNDTSIAKEFLKWNKASGKVLKGLTNRREAEAALYFK